jgi:DNA polymerase-3 subunit epsilon
MATYEVLAAQLEKYDLPATTEELAAYTEGETRFADFAGRIVYDKDGKEVFNFGQHKGKRVADIFKRDTGYYGWLLNGDFPAYTKQIFTRIFLQCK